MARWIAHNAFAYCWQGWAPG